jgi:glycosyltransferase involved in cell wall biosynthesis
MKVAVIIPCLNEQATVAKVVGDCRNHLPTAMVFVLDNGSTDRTAILAKEAGAHVIHSPLRGKGHVLRHALRLIEADYFVMIDGDGTYPVDQAPRLLRLARELNYEMVMGARLQLGKAEAFRPLHYLGNLGFTTLVRLLFGYPVKDLLTGFRVFSRHFVSEVQFISRGFEVETELTIRAVAQNLAFREVAIPYCERPTGSRSKLRTFRDGWVILCTVFRLLRDFRPLLFYLPLGALSLVAAAFVPSTCASALSTLAALLTALGFYFTTRLDLDRFQLQSTTDSAVDSKAHKKSA